MTTINDNEKRKLKTTTLNPVNPVNHRRTKKKEGRKMTKKDDKEKRQWTPTTKNDT